MELDDVFSKINGEWSDEEDGILRRYYKTEGKKSFLRLDGKTEKDCLKRVKLLGLTANRSWTIEEDNILRDNYLTNKDKLWKLLQGRTEASINKRADKLGLRAKWLPEEDLLLMKYWEEKGLYMHQMLPRHGFSEIISRAKRLGLKNSEYD